MYKATLKGWHKNENGTRAILELTNFLRLLNPVDYMVFRKASDGRRIRSITAVQGSIYVFDPNLPTARKPSGWVNMKKAYPSSLAVKEKLKQENIDDHYRNQLLSLKDIGRKEESRLILEVEKIFQS